MKARMKKSLLAAIANVIEQHSQYPDWDGWIPDNLERAMTDAAVVVFDANIEAQRWLQREGHLPK